MAMREWTLDGWQEMRIEYGQESADCKLSKCHSERSEESFEERRYKNLSIHVPTVSFSHHSAILTVASVHESVI